MRRAAVACSVAALLVMAVLPRAAEAAAAPMSFAATGEAIQTRTLANGLQVIVWPDHNIPSVALFNWVRVGSRNEGTGTTGLAHFFEHMMFNGTTHHPRGEFTRLIESNGGSDNAFTSQDVTVYEDWFPRSALELVLQLESDRLANLAFEPQVVEKEREVVYSERRLRVEDSSPAFLSEQVQATAFIAHPYRIPTIGWPSDIKAWTLADLENFYHTWYAPNHCTLVLVGDVEPAQVFALVEKYYGPIPGGPATSPVRTVEPEQTGERRLVIERNGQNPLVQVAWHAMPADDPRAPALNLLQTILTEGDAARLHRALVEERKLAVGVGSGWSEGFDPNLYSVYATLPEGGSSQAFEQALNAEIAKLLDQGVTAAELSRAKHQVAASFWRGVSTIDGKARLLGEYAVLHGDYRKLFAAPDAYERVSAADVLAVARDVFKPAHRTVGVLVPRAATSGP
ncbi:MAG TPA: pitrilysin family protein [Steroidobacteraceae bacterium]|nr:pitrilysin family protein [Steroidobacteraceae bacterium]